MVLPLPNWKFELKCSSTGVPLIWTLFRFASALALSSLMVRPDPALSFIGMNPREPGGA